jgi:hypothetical protein
MAFSGVGRLNVVKKFSILSINLIYPKFKFKTTQKWNLEKSQVDLKIYIKCKEPKIIK